LILGGALTQYAAPAQLSRVSLGGLDRYGSYYEQRMHVRRQARNHVLGLQRLGYKVTLHSPRHRPETRCRPAWSLTAIKQGGGDNASAEPPTSSRLASVPSSAPWPNVSAAS
jgi:hypothetical protein